MQVVQRQLETCMRLISVASNHQGRLRHGPFSTFELSARFLTVYPCLNLNSSIVLCYCGRPWILTLRISQTL